MNWINLIASIYHWESRIEDNIIIFIYKDLKQKWREVINNGTRN